MQKVRSTSAPSLALCLCPHPTRTGRWSTHWWFKTTLYHFLKCAILVWLYHWFLFVQYLFLTLMAHYLKLFILVLYIIFWYNVQSKIKCNIAVSNRLWAWIRFLSNHPVFCHVGHSYIPDTLKLNSTIPETDIVSKDLFWNKQSMISSSAERTCCWGRASCQLLR